MTYPDDFVNKVINMDCIEAMKQMPDESIHCCVTSPPYWGLRDYGVDGQHGLEQSIEEYVNKMVEVFQEVKRILRKDGTLWLNIGDSYKNIGKHDIIKAKELCLIPARVVLALQADGWYVRSDIIWAKTNPMPESVTDRPTKSHEYIFLLTKSDKYYYDNDSIRTPHDPETLLRMNRGTSTNNKNVDGPKSLSTALSQPKLNKKHKNLKHKGENPHTMHLERAKTKHSENNYGGGGSGFKGHSGNYDSDGELLINPLGANKKTVWQISTVGYSAAHFATFPPKLIEPCILAGSPKYVCGVCGMPWTRVILKKSSSMNIRVRDNKKGIIDKKSGVKGKYKASKEENNNYKKEISGYKKSLGWKPSCEHNDNTGRSIVLDHYAGSGTTGMVSQKYNRNFILIEINSEYIKFINDRIIQPGLGV